MRCTPQLYAQALWEVLKDTPNAKHVEVLSRFVDTIARNGDLPRSRAIVSAVQEYGVRVHGGRLIRLEVARHISESLMKKITKEFAKDDQVETIVNSSLVAGARITINGEQELDMSLSRKLKKMFV